MSEAKMTAEEAVRELGAALEGMPIDFSKHATIMRCLKAIEAELKAPRFSAEEREALEVARAGLIMSAMPSHTRDRFSATIRKMLEAP
jgi:hypothetical protein